MARWFLDPRSLMNVSILKNTLGRRKRFKRIVGWLAHWEVRVGIDRSVEAFRGEEQASA